MASLGYILVRLGRVCICVAEKLLLSLPHCALLVNIALCLAVFDCCSGPPAQVGAACTFMLLSWTAEGSKPDVTQHSQPVCLSPLPQFLHLRPHIPAVRLSALSQRWCETWRQGAWAAGLCQLTLWPPALPPQLRVPMPQLDTTGHLYCADSWCEQSSLFMLFGLHLGLEQKGAQPFVRKEKKSLISPHTLVFIIRTKTKNY